MKRFYLTANVILVLAAALLLLGHFNFKPSPPDKALKRTVMPSVTSGEKVEKESAPQAFPPPDMQEKNLFDPQRGKAPATGDMTAMPQNMPPLELIGICCLGESLGAIIVEKGLPMAATARQPGRGNDRKNVKKRYFKQGEEVMNGYCLNEIDTDKVILKRGHDVIELKVGRERFAAQSGTNRNNTPNTPVTINSQQARGGTPNVLPPPPPPSGVGRVNMNQPPPQQNVRR